MADLVEIQKEWLKSLDVVLTPQPVDPSNPDGPKKPNPSEQNEINLKRREEGLTLINSLDSQKDQIRQELLKVEVTVKSGVFSNKKMKLLDEDGDYRNEIDTWHHAKLIKESMTDKQLESVQAEVSKIMDVMEQLRDNEYYFPVKPDWPPLPDPDFEGMTEQEQAKAILEYDALIETRQKAEADYRKAELEGNKRLSEDMWAPLVREGVIPENFVPDAYSEVALLFEAASGAYEERLLEYSAELTDDAILLQKFDIGFRIGKGILKLGGEVAGLTGEIGKMGGDEALEAGAAEAADFIKELTVALTLTEGVVKAALTDKDFTSIGQEIASYVAEKTGADKALGAVGSELMEKALNNGARAVSVAGDLKLKEYARAFQAMADGMGAELIKFDPIPGGAMTILGKALQNDADGVAQSEGLSDLGEKTPVEIMAALKKAATKLSEKALASVPDEAKTALKKLLASEGEDAGDDDAPEEEAPSNAILKEKTTRQLLDERAKEADALAAEKITKSMEEQQAADDAQYQMHLRAGMPMSVDGDDEVNISNFERQMSIEYLMAMQRKNEATFNFCKGIAAKGAGLLTKVFPPAGLVEACITLAFTIRDAVKKTEEMLIWRENVADAKNAVSAQVDAMLNRSGLQTKQAALANIQVALDAAKVVAEVLAMTPAAPAGPIVKASAATAEAAIELADLIYTEVQLAKAWKIYEKARDMPQDRYLARKATRENPTLAKYAMAYGAINGDPIAMEGMRRCGLNKQTLAVPSSEVNKVVSYLEAKYPDDPVLLRAVPVPEKWYPGPVELTSRSWVMFYRMATTKASPLVDPGNDTSGISGSIGKLDDAEAAFAQAIEQAMQAVDKFLAVNKLRKAGEDDPEPSLVLPETVDFDEKARVVLVANLLKLKEQLSKYKPMTVPAKKETSKPHLEMAKYVDALSANCERRLVSVTKLMGEAPWARKYSAGLKA